MKKVIVGWIGKEDAKMSEFRWEPNIGYGILLMPNIFRRKSVKEDWDETFWPPIKVRITVEVL